MSLASLTLYLRGRSPCCQLNRRVIGPHILLEGVKKININESAAIETFSLLMKLDILTQGPGFTSSFVLLTVIGSEIVTGLSGCIFVYREGGNSYWFRYEFRPYE